jgi:hypothetical protein
LRASIRHTTAAVTDARYIAALRALHRLGAENEDTADAARIGLPNGSGSSFSDALSPAETLNVPDPPLMIERDWLTCDDPERMLDFAGTADERKLNLLAAACCRQVWALLLFEASKQSPTASADVGGHDA